MNCLCFALLHSVIGSKFLCHFFKQSEVKPKPKPIVACTCTFSCGLCRLHVCVITLSFDWFTGLATVITLVLVLDTRLELALLQLHYDTNKATCMEKPVIYMYRRPIA